MGRPLRIARGQTPGAFHSPRIHAFAGCGAGAQPHVFEHSQGVDQLLERNHQMLGSLFQEWSPGMELY